MSTAKVRTQELDLFLDVIETFPSAISGTLGNTNTWTPERVQEIVRALRVRARIPKKSVPTPRGKGVRGHPDRGTFVS